MQPQLLRNYFLIQKSSISDILADPLFDTEYRHLALKQLEQQKRDQTSGDDTLAAPAAPAEVVVDMKRELLESNPTRVRRLGQILFPTLIEVYSSTVHYQIRQRAILGLVKLAYFSEEAVLRDVLKVLYYILVPVSNTLSILANDFVWLSLALS